MRLRVSVVRMWWGVDVRLSRGKGIPFAHNSVDALEENLKLISKANSQSQKPQSIIVAVESIYSMDGDIAPLETFASLCEEYDASLIVDEVSEL